MICRLIAIIGLAVFVVACSSGSVTTATASPKTSPSALIVFTTWVPDPKVANGPEAGYKPAFTGLTGHDVQSAAAAIDSTGTSWIVNLSFTPRGANLFAQLTHDNVAACPGDANGAGLGCPQRHLAIWLDLTQADLDRWEDPVYVDTVSRPYDLGCLTAASSRATCAKLISDPIVLQEINGGHVTISVADQQGADELATAINSAARS